MIVQPRLSRSRAARAAAGSLALAMGVGCGLFFGAGPAAAQAPRAQAVGRFLDGAAGGSPIQSIVDLKDARATNPGSVSDQNPLDITVGGQGDIPLSHKLQGPGSGDAFHVGVADQIAKARSNGFALGAAGAVANQGGASLGGQSGRYPSNATLDLSSAAFPSAPIPLPGGGGAPALGGLTASIGAVSAEASTPAGVGRAGVTHYNIADLRLTLASPSLGGALTQLGDALKPPAGLPVKTVPACSFKTQFLSPATVAGGALTIDPANGAITLDVSAALRALGLNLNYLPANTDLMALVTKYLASPNGLAAGMQQVIGNSFVTQKANFEKCAQALDPTGKFGNLISQLTAGQQALTNAINGAVHQLTGAGGPDPFAPLVNGLKQGLQVGVNVQPNGPRGSYASPLNATPDQATPVVAGQTIVRALEIDLGGGQGVSLALANAAAGPSSAAPTAPSPKPSLVPHVKHNHVIPTGVPAGQGPIGGQGMPLPIVLVSIGVALAAAGGVVTAVRCVRPQRH
jgi:hypothetical protein